jgi:hypothetical protein
MRAAPQSAVIGAICHGIVHQTTHVLADQSVNWATVSPSSANIGSPKQT